MTDIEELREATREMHAAMKDAKQLLKAMQTVKDELLSAADEVFDERMDEIVRTTLEEYKDNMKAQTDRATQAVFDRFEAVSDTLLSKDGAMDFTKMNVIQFGEGGDIYQVVERRAPMARP